MSIKRYYEKYWKNELPPMMFFNEPPKWPEKTVKRYVSFVRCWIGPFDFILDFGSGEGHFVNILKKMRIGAEACGVDISEEAVKKARKIYPFGDFFDTTKDIGFNFDVITCFDVFEHIFDFDEVFDYFDKHLKKGGRLIIATNENCFIKMVAIGLFYMDNFFHWASPHIRFFTKKSLEEMLKYYGYKVIHFERTGNNFGFLSTGQFVVAEKVR
jgi:2-polyprenyl-3-methyl-5-hydroxy-6-metoxy-1,4-benzoquinol methylase